MSGAPRTCIVRIACAASSAVARKTVVRACGSRVWSSTSTRSCSEEERSVCRSGVNTLFVALEDLDDVVEVVSPQPPARPRLDLLGYFVDLFGFECVLAVRKEHPVAAASHRLFAIVGDQHRMHGLCIGELLHDRCEIEITIGYMEGDDPAGLHVSSIDPERLGGDEVHWNRVAREGVNGKHVEILRRLAFQTEPCIAERDLDRRIALADIAEVAFGDA